MPPVLALTLEGRNEKTLWRLEWDQLDNVAKRRSAATNRMLRKAYEAYRKAYPFDLNHYWSGLAALQHNTGAVVRGDVAGHIRQRRPSAGLSGGTEAIAGSASPHRISGYRDGARSDVPQRPKPRVGRNQRCGPYVSSRGTPKPGERSLQRSGSQKWVLRVECGERTVGALHKARLQGRTRKQDHFDDRHARCAARG